MFNRVCLIALGIVIGGASVSDASVDFVPKVHGTDVVISGAVTTTLASLGGSISNVYVPAPNQVMLSATLNLENNDGQSYLVICEFSIDGVAQGSTFSKTSIQATGSYGGGGPMDQTMALQGQFAPSAGFHTYAVMCAIAGGAPPPTSTLAITAGDLRVLVIGSTP